MNRGLPDMRISDRTLICIPAFNESESIADTLRSLLAFAPRENVIVIDDGSSDDTAIKARSLGITTLRLVVNQGVGAAMRTGFLFARENGFDRLIQFDADGQHLPEYLFEIEQRLSTFDVVVGSRFKEHRDYEVGIVRSLAMNFLSKSISGLISVKMTDVTSGFRGASRRAIELYSEHYPTEYLGDTVESLIIAHKHGLSISEVGVKMRPRFYGNPSNGPFRSTLSMFRMIGALAIFTANSIFEK